MQKISGRDARNGEMKMRKMKKILAVILTIAFILSFSLPLLAADFAPRGGGRGFRAGAAVADAPRQGMEFSGGIGMWGAGFNYFWDADGNFLSRETVEANLATAVANGDLTAAQRDLLLERYDFCATRGGGASGSPRGLRGGSFCPWLN